MSRDYAYLRHILDEIMFLRSASTGLDIAKLKDDPVMQRAFLRSLEVIGEAVKNLSDGLREDHAEVEWRRVAGLRDRLIHHYFEVDWKVVWDVVINKLPELQDRIEAIVAELQENER